MEQDLQRLTAVEQRSRSNTHRIDALEKNQEVLNRLATAVEVLAAEQKHLRQNVDAVCGKIDVLEQRPAKRWELVVNQIITAVVSAAVTYFLLGLGVSG